MKPVIIKWIDITSDMVWNDKPTPLKCMEFQTIGFLIEEGKDSISICDTDPGFGNRCIFPKGCVKEIIELTPIKGKKNGTTKKR